MVQSPSAYVEGYAKARLYDQPGADHYIRHTTIGDPVLDPVLEELSSLPPADLHRFVEAGIEQHDEALRNAPQALREFFENLEEPPWLDYDSFRPGSRAFYANVSDTIAAFLCGVLVEGFTTLIRKSFVITGRVLLEPTQRRQKQNIRQLIDIFLPDGLQRYGDGLKLSMRIRFIHARIRNLLTKSDDWNHDAWGTPLSAAQLGFAIAVFSARLMQYSIQMGAIYNQEEIKSALSIWRYTGYVMGIPESILYTNERRKRKKYTGSLHMCEPPAGCRFRSAMANALINSIPADCEYNGVRMKQKHAASRIWPTACHEHSLATDSADQFQLSKEQLYHGNTVCVQGSNNVFSSDL